MKQRRKMDIDNIMEIGGEFYTYDIDENIQNESCCDGGDIVYTLSGRTSIDFIIKDIKKERQLDLVALPSYCCDCMIEPFLKNGVEVVFYDVLIEKHDGLAYDFSHINIKKKINAVLSMEYFGFYRSFAKNIFSHLSTDIIKIYDRTHSALCSCDEVESDYYFSSMRKWARFNGLSPCNKKSGVFNVSLSRGQWPGINLRKKAAERKRNYISRGVGEKEVFLKFFHNAEEMLEHDYEGYEAATEDLDAYKYMNRTGVVQKRRENAEFLIDNLKNLEGINLLYKTVEEKDCPLFVPIILKNELRNKLQAYLIERDIYCPIHWPISRYHILNKKETKELYLCELSLLCDQRYNIVDMDRIVCEIKKFAKENF